jgi:hypothetical protein
MENPKDTTTPSVKKEAAVSLPPKFIYIGPGYTNAIMRAGVVYQPKLMSEEQIENLIAAQAWASEWFKKA